MEGFSYTNIFETKGIEYLTIIAFFAILVPFWMLITRKTKSRELVSSVKGFISASSIRIPQGIFFSRFHTWAHLEKTGEARVGLDDLLVHLTGDIKVIPYKTPGDQIEKGELLARIAYNGNSLNVLSPISGKIEESNSELDTNPDALKSDPYQLGWIYSIKPTNWKVDTDLCYLAEDATTWAVQELERFKDFLAVSASKMMPQPVGFVMQDGGEIVEKPLANFPQEVWEEFQKNFLS